MKRPSPSWRSERLFQSQQPLFPLPQLGGGYCGHQHPLALPQPAAGDPGARLRRPLPNLRPLRPPGGKRRLFPVPPLLFGEPAAGLPPFPGGGAPGASAPFGTQRDGGCRRGGGGYATALYGVYTAALFLPFGAACWLPPLLGRFDFPSRELWRTAFLLALGHLPTTLLSVLLTAGAAFACLLCFPLLFLLPVVLAIALSFPMERVFRKYMAK